MPMHAPRAPAYDPFGEPTETEFALPAGERRVRVAGAVVFWTLALLLTAGRVYNGVQPVTFATAPAQVALLSIVIQ